MEKQFWVLCQNNLEEKELLKMLNNYEQNVDNNKTNFPIVVDEDEKLVYRCTSVTCCACYCSSGNKMMTLNQFKEKFNKE